MLKVQFYNHNYLTQLNNEIKPKKWLLNLHQIRYTVDNMGKDRKIIINIILTIV